MLVLVVSMCSIDDLSTILLARAELAWLGCHGWCGALDLLLLGYLVGRTIQGFFVALMDNI
jgi:hypothetical protein